MTRFIYIVDTSAYFDRIRYEDGVIRHWIESKVRYVKPFDDKPTLFRKIIGDVRKVGGFQG